MGSIFGNVFGGSGDGAGGGPTGAIRWSSGTTYLLGAVVEHNGVLYTSLQTDNIGNQPDTSPTYWEGITTPGVTTDSIGISSGTIDVGDAVRISEGSNSLFISEKIEDTIGSALTVEFTSTGSSTPVFFELEAEQNLVINSDDTVNITTNPLTFTITATADRQINVTTFRSYAITTNVRGKFIHVPSGTVIKYFPSKYAYDQGVGGYTITKIGDIVINFIDDLPNDEANGLYYIASSPFRIINGDSYEVEIISDTPFLKGDALDNPYMDVDAQNGSDREIGYGDHSKRNKTTGLLDGGVISIASATTVSWTAGNGIIVDYSDPNNPLVYDIAWDAVTGYTPTNLATDGTTLFGYDNTGSVVEILAPAVTPLDSRLYIFFGSATHLGGNIVQINTAPGNLAYDRHGAFKDFFNLVIGPANVDGNVYGPNGVNLNIDVEGGPAYMLGSNQRNEPRVPDIITLPSGTAITFYKVYREADPSLVMAYDGLPTTNIDPTQYDDGSGTLQSVTAGYWTIQRIFRSRTGQTLVAYGQQEFATKELALEALSDEPFEEKMPLPLTLFRGSLAVAQNATDLSDTDQAEFFEQSSFRIRGAVSSGTSIPGITAPGGVDRSVQFNDAGVFGGTDKFRFSVPSDYATITMESLGVAGGANIIFNNSSAFQRLYMSYQEGANASILESVSNDLTIITQNTLTLSYGSCSATFNDTLGNNTFNLKSSASNKDILLTMETFVGATVFKVEHNDVSAQTSLSFINDSGNTKFATTYNSTLDDVFMSTGNGCDLYITSDDLLFLRSTDTMTIEALGNFPITLVNDEASFTMTNSTTNYAFIFSNTLGNTVPLLVLEKTGPSGGVSQIFTSSVAPEGAITGNGGDLCIQDSGITSEFYIKLSDGGNTGWERFLHGSSGVQGPTTSTDNAIATWDGTDGLTLQDSNASVISTTTSTALNIDAITSVGSASLHLRNSLLANKFTIAYDDSLNRTLLETLTGDSLAIVSNTNLLLESNTTLNITNLSGGIITMSNDESSFALSGSTGGYAFSFSNTEPNTEPLLILAKDDITGGVSRVYISNSTPEGAITANGGALCIVSDDADSNIYLKLNNATNTTWQSLLGDVVGPTSSTDNAIALFDGTTGKLLQSSSLITVSEVSDTELRLKSPSATVGSQIVLESFAGSRLTLFQYDETAIRTTMFLSGTSHSFRLDANGVVDLRTFSDDPVTINNDNASYFIGGSTQSYQHRITNNQPNTNSLIRYTQSGLNGGTFDLFVSTVAPEGVITASGGGLCLVDSGTSSDLYIKRTDTGNTGWVDFLHGASGVQGPATSTDNAIAVWNGIDGLTLQDSYSSLVSTASSTLLSVDNVSATGTSGYQIRNNTQNTRYSVTYNQSTNGVFTTTTSGASYTGIFDGSYQHESFSNVAIGSLSNQLVELYNTNALLRLDVAANGGRLYFNNTTADTEEMIELLKGGTNGGTIDLYVTSRSPLGNITANGGSFAFRDAGTSSNFYLKRVDGGTTGWNVGITKDDESSTLNALAIFDVTTGNSITDAATATLIIDTNSTALELKPVTSAGNAEVNFRTSSGFIQAQIYYDEDVSTFNIEAQSTSLNIGNFAGPIRFASSSVDSAMYLTNTYPVAVLSGNPGDINVYVNGASSEKFINKGSVDSNRVWSKFALDSDTNAYGGFGRLQNRIRWSEDLTQSTWVDGLGNTTIIPNATVGPNGELVDNVQWDSAGLGLRAGGLGTIDGNNYTVSFWAKHISGANQILIVDLNDGGAVGLTIDSNEWQRYHVALVAGASGQWLDITHNSTSTFAIWGVQVNDGIKVYPYLKREDIALKDTTEYGLSVDGKIVFTGSVIDSDDIITNLVTGVLEGGAISINGVDDSLIDVTAGKALIADYTTPGSPNIREITWDAQTVDPVLGATEFIKWIGVQESATPGVGEFVFDIEFTQLEKRTIAIVGRCWGDGVTDSITAVGQYTTPATGQGYVANDLSYVLGSMNKRGNVFGANGANLLLDKSAGVSYRYTANYLGNPTAPNVHTDSAQTGITTYWYLLQNSLVADIQSDIDPDNYDNAGTKTAVPSGKYTLQRLYYYPVSQLLAPTYGQKLYDSMGEAIGAAGEDIVETPQELLEGAILRGWIALKQGATALNDTSQALFKEARSIGDQPAKGTVGTTLSYRNYAVADIGASGIHYYAGFYQAPAASVTLTIGGTVTQVYGTANTAIGAHAFCVASGAGGTDLVLTVSGTSITEEGVRTPGDSEIIVPDTDQATTNQYFETSKFWLGQITYTLTGAAGSFTFNYGFAKYDDFSNRDFTITDFQVIGQGAASETALDIQLLHHKATGWTYSAGAFIPGTGFVVSLANDYSTDDNLVNNVGFAYKRTNLSTFVSGSGSEGLLVKFSTATNNSISSATIEVGALV